MDKNLLTFLLVDDNGDFTNVFRKAVIERFPDAIWYCESEIDAGLRLAESQMPDVTFLSLALKDISGQQAVEHWFANRSSGEALVILADAVEEALFRDAFKKGAAAFLLRDDIESPVLDHVLSTALTFASASIDGGDPGFKKLFSISSDAMILVEPQTGEIMEVNSQALAMYGYTRNEFKFLRLEDLEMKRDDHEKRLSLPAFLERNDGSTHRCKHVTKEGRLLYVDVTSSPITMGNQDWAAVVIRDLSDQRQREQEILFLQEFNSNILDSLPFSIMVKTENHRVTYQNRLALDTFGSLIGTTFDLGVRSQSSLQPYEENYVPQSTEIEWDNEPYEITVLRIRDHRSGENLVVELGQNISQKRQIQSELIQAQRMEAVGNLARGIAHDFNNLLSGILGYANLIQTIDEDNEQLGQYAEIIEDTCIRASELTRQLLQFARQKTKSSDIFDLNAIIRYAAKLLRHSEKKEIRFSHRLVSDDLHIMGDAAQVQQMLINLVLNAYDYMSSGQVSVSSKIVDVTPDHKLVSQGFSEGSYAAVMIKDSGRDLGGDSLKLLDETDITDQDGGEGLGLEMSVAHAIIRSHQGKVTVESTQKSGNRITIYFPRIIQLPEHDDIQPDEMLRGNETVLVIDDEEVIRNLMLTSLSRFGYRVLVASGAEEGLEAYEKYKTEIDLIMLDIGLPVMNGTKVFDIVREMDPEARVIFFTGSGNRKQMDTLAIDDSVDWVKKPISLKRLTQKMRNLFDLHSDKAEDTI